MAESTIASPGLKPHLVSGIFPKMSPVEFRALVDDIKVNGLREPIVLHEGEILDGNHRYQACLESGITPRTKIWLGQGLPIDFVVSMNLKRRHLTSGQRAAASDAAIPFYKEAAKKRKRESGEKHGPGQKVSQRIDRPIDDGRATERQPRLSALTANTSTTIRR